MSVGGGSSEYVLEGRVESSGVDSFTNQMGGAESSLMSFKGAVGATGVALGALAAGGLAASVGAAAKFQTAMTDLEKVTDPSTAREMGSAIKDMAGTMPLAQTELAGIAEQAGRLGVSGTKNIREFTRVTAEMATATDLSAQEAADSFARMSTLMNEPISNVRKIGDATNRLSNTMATSSSEITDAATRSAGSLSNMGASSSEVLALNATLNTVSSSARIAGTRLRRLGQEMMNPKKIQGLSNALNMTTEEFKNIRSNDPTKLIKMMATAMGEGGSKANSLRKVLSTTSRGALSSLSQNLDGLNTALGESQKQFKQGGSLAKEFETASQTFSNQLQLLKNELTNVAISIGSVLLPPLTTLVQWATGVIGKFQAFNEATNGVFGAVTLLTTAIGGLVGGGALLLSQFGYLAPLISGVGAAFSALLGPLGLVAAGVVGLGTAFATNFAGIRSTTMEVVGVLRNQFVRVMAALESTVMPILSAIAGAWEGQGGRIQSVASGLVQELAGPLMRTIQMVGTEAVRVIQWFASMWQTHGQAILTTISTISGHLTEGLIQAMAMVRGLLDGDMVQVRYFFSETKRHILAVWNTLWSAVVSGVQWVIPRLVALGGRIVGAIRSALGQAWEWVRTTGVSLAVAALTFLGQQAIAAFAFGREHILPAVQNALSAAWTWVRTTGVALAVSALTFLGQQAINAFTFARENILPKVTAALGAVWTWIRESAVPAAISALGFLATQAINAFTFTRENIVPPIQQALGQAWTWIRENGVAAAKNAFGFLKTQALNTWAFVREDVVPSVMSALGKVWTWLRENAVGLAKGAFSAVVDGALAVWTFTREDVVPAVSGALGMVNTWLRENGVGIVEGAFGWVATQGANAFDFGGGEGGGGLVGKAQSAIDGINQWIRNSGVPMLKGAVSFLATQAANIFGTWNQDIQPKINSAIGGVVTWLKNQGLSLFKGAFRSIGRNLGPSLTTLLDSVGNAFKNGIPMIRDWLRNNGLRLFKQGFRAIVRGIVTVVKGAFAIAGLVGQAIVSTINGIRDWLSTGGATKLKNGFVNIVSGIVSYLKNDAWGDLKGAAEFLFDAVIAAAEILYEEIIGNSIIKDMMEAVATYIRNFDLLSPFQNIFDSIMQRASQFASDMWNNINEMATSVYNRVSQWASNMWNRANKMATSVYNRVSQWTSNMWNKVNEMASSIVARIQQFASSVWNKVNGMASSVFNRISQWASNMWNKVDEMASSIVTRAQNWVSNFTQPFIDAKNAVEEKFQSLKDTIIGNSTVPDMLDELVTEAEGSWSDKFIAPFDDAVSSIMEKFNEAKDKITGGGAGGGGGALSGVPGDIRSQIKSAYNSGQVNLKGEGGFAPIKSKTSLGALASAARDYGKLDNGNWREDTLRAGALEGVFESGYRLRGLASGGSLLSDGVYYGHAGETVVPADVSQPYSGGDGNTASTDPAALADGVARALGGARIDLDTDDDELRQYGIEGAELVLEEEKKDVQARMTR